MYQENRHSTKLTHLQSISQNFKHFSTDLNSSYGGGQGKSAIRLRTRMSRLGLLNKPFPVSAPWLTLNERRSFCSWVWAHSHRVGWGAVRKLVSEKSALSCYQDIIPKLAGLGAGDHEAAVPFNSTFSKLGYHPFLLVKLSTQFSASNTLKLKRAVI